MPEPDAQQPETSPEPVAEQGQDAGTVREHGGPKGPEPTRYGDWEYKGRCIDF